MGDLSSNNDVESLGGDVIDEVVAVDISLVEAAAVEGVGEETDLLADTLPSTAEEESESSDGYSDSDSIIDATGVDDDIIPTTEDTIGVESSDSVDDTAPLLSVEEEDDDDDDDENSLITQASNIRLEAKTLHDSGNLQDAAIAFHNAASLLDEARLTSDNIDADGADSIVVERATCKLHEALCLFKDGKPGECVLACTDVLGDGVGISTEDVLDEENGEEKEVIRVISSTSQSAPATSATSINIPSLIRARAHHRRAKARLALNDLDGALDDARSAAFMGDRNAVQFYGRLMREGSGAGGGDMSAGNNAGAGGLWSPPSTGGSSNPFLDGMLQSMGGSGTGAASNDFSSSLLSSLLTNDNGSSGGDLFGLMGNLLSPPSNNSKGKKRGRRGKSRKNKGGGGMDNLAKSVMSSLLKRIEDDDTQEMICTYLQSTNQQQIQTFASMAGVPLKEDNARRLAAFANAVTVKGIRKAIARIKRSISVIKTCRKILKVIDKYKVVIIIGLMCYWWRSAITRPYPVNTRKAKKEILQKAAAFGLLIAPISSTSSSRLYLGDTEGDIIEASPTTGGIESELERLQNQFTLIEALEERNKAQLGSFIDEEDQRNSLEEDERILLNSKDSIIQKMEQLSEK